MEFAYLAVHRYNTMCWRLDFHVNAFMSTTSSITSTHRCSPTAARVPSLAYLQWLHMSSVFSQCALFCLNKPDNSNTLESWTAEVPLLRCREEVKPADWLGLDEISPAAPTALLMPSLRKGGGVASDSLTAFNPEAGKPDFSEHECRGERNILGPVQHRLAQPRQPNTSANDCALFSWLSPTALERNIFCSVRLDEGWWRPIKTLAANLLLLKWHFQTIHTHWPLY